MAQKFGQFFALLFISLSLLYAGAVHAEGRRLAYLVSDSRIPYWDIMKRGIESRAESLGYELTVYSAENNAKQEVANAINAIKNRVDGIILSPTNSSTAVTLLKLAKDAHIPVVIADIGADGGDYVSYIASDNHEGAYLLGRLLTDAMHQKKMDKGSVGIIAIPQKRANGKARTAGFMQALNEAGIKSAGIRQQVDFSYKETYDFARELILNHPELRALWLQGSDRYQGALDAIADTGKTDQMLLICFDAEPEFVGMIAKGLLAGAGMQQPFMMGEEAVRAMDRHLKALPVRQSMLLPVLAVSMENLNSLLPTIRRNVLGEQAGK
ncbi:MAG: substrate-binding domain-containing protein [Gallionella sp.]|jgi:ABC-type sugar transport system substrate-binding protein